MRNMAVFILTHGRSGRVITYNTLRKSGYTKDIFLVLDTDDDQIDLYKKEFGEQNCIVFSKDDWRGRFDIGDNGGDDRVVVYARNAVWDIARQKGFRYFVVLDDDYKSFDFRYIEGEKLAAKRCTKLDEVFDISFDFLDESGAATVCFAQAGDFIGGSKSGRFHEKLLRKAMNVWFMDTEKQFDFYGRINEDTTTYTLLGGRGVLFFTFTDIACVQNMTQTNKGGLTEIYTEQGTWLKTFYTVMMCPSCTKVIMMGDKHMRMHHSISWNNAVPKILNEEWKKKDGN